MASAGISRLPVEIIQSILLALTDIKTLKSVILSSSIFYGPFKGLEQKVIEEVTQRDFTPGLLRLALAIEILPQVTYSEVTCLAAYLGTNAENNASLSMREFHSLLNQQNISIYAMMETLCWVDHLADGFARSQLKRAPKTLKHNQDQSLSQNERNRIRHCLYRLAIHDELPMSFTKETQFIQDFIDNFSAWDIEELCRISKYLRDANLPGEL